MQRELEWILWMTTMFTLKRHPSRVFSIARCCHGDLSVVNSRMMTDKLARVSALIQTSDDP